jgi:hypothetical protein
MPSTHDTTHAPRHAARLVSHRFTWWHSYKESEAKADISRWTAGNLPIDIWALDMNWRETDDNKDHFYDHANTALFAGLNNSKNDTHTEWFEYLRSKKLRTYFNDHVSVL